MTERRDAPMGSAAEVPAATAYSSLGSVARNVLELIGRTPLVRLERMETPPSAQLWGKAEFLNPARSVKDRPALSMIQAAEAAGALQAGATLIEATSGNTGISLAMIAAVRGYRCVLVMPEDMSLERRHIMRAYGAEIALTTASDGMLGAVRHAEKLLRETPGAFMPRQFENPANPACHYRETANEILAQLGGSVAAFVAGVGTGGTLTGVGRCLRERLGSVQIVAVEPKNSPVLSGGRAGLHSIQGLGAGFVPAILDRSVIDEVMTVADAAAERCARRLAQAEGLLVGPSAGANVCAAALVAQRLPPGSNVVTILCDSGERYLF
ncbi:MAG: hypothetical protein RL685_5563 [Pseudomonadota bacterium]|jgi:cysteine synthase A